MSWLYDASYQHGYAVCMRALSQSMLSRRDAETARLVELAVQVEGAAGTQAAARLLAHAGVTIEIAARVLSQPHSRRGRVNRMVARPQ